MNLNISISLHLPIEFLSLRTVVFGGSGAGKTALGRVIFEEATKVGIPCGVIDLKADWWGLRSSADGRNDGLPVVIFGGEHQDVPINESGGAELAEIVAELRQPFIIDLEEFSKAKQLKFLAPFFDRFYDKNREPVKLICDESDRYIPQRILFKDPNAALCLGAGEDIAKRGRKHGIFPMFISQRNADLNKSVTELCDVAVIFRTAGPNDQKAVNDWLECKGSLITEEQRLTVMENISGLQNGEAIICSAHPQLKIFKQVQMRMPETFDSSATPEIGKQLIQPKKLARIELTALSDRMKATIEQAKAKDPQVLQAEIRVKNAQITKLERDIVSFQNARINEKTIEKVKEVPALSNGERTRLTKLTAAFDKLYERAEQGYLEVQSIGQATNDLKPEIDCLRKLLAPVTAPLPVPRPEINKRDLARLPREFGSVENPPRAKTIPNVPRNPMSFNGDLPKGEAIILSALIQFPAGLNREQLTVLAGFKKSTRDAYIQRLREKGYVDCAYEGNVVATESGRNALPNAQPLPTGEALQAHWLNKLPDGERRILEVLLAAYPESVDREFVSEQTQFKKSTRDAYLQRMSSKMVVTEPGRGLVRAADTLFE